MGGPGGYTYYGDGIIIYLHSKIGAYGYNMQEDMGYSVSSLTYDEIICGMGRRRFTMKINFGGSA